eukprot:TRINITY_DN1258_c0_g3_i1.p1 TRINITY_DN1258_c0_g3~~TRINITY_DN1258_c0_g3_i1.p1  ORF type:complete len:306 (+),score=86.81 TRINITY_DN1258_c0_g3_i1:130-1047(+)
MVAFDCKTEMVRPATSVAIVAGAATVVGILASAATSAAGAFLSTPSHPGRLQVVDRAAVDLADAPRFASSIFDGAAPTVAAASLAVVGAGLVRALRRNRRQQGRGIRETTKGVACKCAEEIMEGKFGYGDDLSVPADSFVALGLAHCFEQVEQGKLKDVYVLEPIAASTVEVINNGAQTSYETFIGTTVGEVLSQDTSAFPKELLDGHDEVQWGDNLEFRTGCAARTWMRDHAKDVVMKLVPKGEVKGDFNTSTEHKRILNFVNEVKDSDNIKQDMSIDVYGREDDESAEGDDALAAQIEELSNA